MHTRSHTRSVAIPRPPQCVAALLPPEIIDCIFSHFDFDYSTNASGQDRIERGSNLSNMSVIAKGWKGPARRLLCRTVRIDRWDQMAEGVPEWARGGLQNVGINDYIWATVQTQEAASATFRFLTNAPNLRVLRLSALPFTSFSSSESTSLRTTHFLPLLRDLTVFSNTPFPHSMIFDFLATSNRQISRFRVGNAFETAPPIPGDRLDFGGNLRYLRYGGLPSLETLQLGSLAGLKELFVERVFNQSTEQAMELLSVVAPTLEKLGVCDGENLTMLAESLPLLIRLTQLLLPDIPATLTSLPLPSSLVSLQIFSDDNLRPLLDRWNAKPALLPATLQHITILLVHDFRTLERLPPIATFRILYHERTEALLHHLAPRTVPFKTLEVYFRDHHLDRVAAIGAECKRLGVKFCRRFEQWEV